ncbi:MAG: serine hydrolase domain-containing protein [Lachnospiraceae bacterium]
MPDQTRFSRPLAALWKRFDTWEIPVHSLLVSQHGKLLWETYRPPYQTDTLHRMFSITKSYCALAVGALAAEGKLALHDPIIRFFPEYQPADGSLHPDLTEMTIRDLLTMQTCHSATTYKLDPNRNWVESFFITPPTHKSGRIFMYDTSASHTMAALVKKLTGLGVLDYLRPRYLDRIGFSADAYIIRDPFGTEMGGSGLMARPMDLLKTARSILDQIQQGTDAYADYLRDAVRCQVPTRHYGQTLDEQQGYGYQFWRIRGGFAMYGMGSQYVLFYPDSDLIIVITADSQNIKGGSQKILDAVYDTIAPFLCCTPHNGSTSANTEAGTAISSAAAHTYQLRPNKGGFTNLAVTVNTDGGILSLKHPDAVYEIPFGWNTVLHHSVIAKYNQPIASSGQWLDRHSLLVSTQIAGECVGSLTFMMCFASDGVTLWMKKIEESLFHEFCDFAEGVSTTHS